ncbi:MarR family winged helix-turn-helix transcriptional regulator [Cellulomonas alba]|uniref:MarR family transcriptional regulator n=1 Tax=Cellulomonas alba TaxID=3053467 RepID=A0ABT7SI96_9CELL|nr:MarR family transcriptional regulator [Cellulomonas alba]MDM7855284.1 MarR family transcriptional regulator [Cellulomonas alba]
MPGPSVAVSTAVMRLARELRAALDRAFDDLGLTSQQAALLIHMVTGATSPKELAGLLGVDTAGMTRMLDRLERKGLVTRAADPDDRRAVRVSPTPAGAALVPRLAPIFDRVSAALVGDLDARDLTRTVEALLANLHDADAR